ncbi:MAG TPA: suppressor of fused domain protein [Jatrophihabitans sp.]|nr:suppressor of fused domain protein [Jatrophihabitans sp.]
MHPDSGDVLATVEAAYHEHFEIAPERASISFVGVEPIEVLRYHELDGGSAITHYITLGMSRRPMTDAAAEQVADTSGPRAELLLSVFDRPDDVWRRLAVLAAAPSVESAVYAPGGRVELGEPWLAGSRCTGAVFDDGPLVPIALAMASAVRVLRVLPAHPAELAWARAHGSDALIARWAEADVELRDLLRDPVDLA